MNNSSFVRPDSYKPARIPLQAFYRYCYTLKYGYTQRLTVDVERHPLADRGRHVVAGDAEVDSHLSSVHLPEGHGTTVKHLHWNTIHSFKGFKVSVYCLKISKISDLVTANSQRSHASSQISSEPSCVYFRQASPKTKTEDRWTLYELF